MKVVLLTGQRKPDFVRLCQATHDINIQIYPGGFLEDREEVIGEKLQTAHRLLYPTQACYQVPPT